MNKPTILIGSSSEGMPLTRALQQGLEHEAEILVWNQDVFSVGEYLLDTLLRSLDSVDLAVLVIIPEDVLTLRRRTIASMRDNVLFELGLFIGRLARSRVVVVMPEDDLPLRLPSDPVGVTVARYRSRRDGNLVAVVRPACDHITMQVKAVASVEHSQRSTTPIDQYSCFISYGGRDKAFSERIYDDLQVVGICCWLDSKDLRIGDDVALKIDRAVQLTDKVLLILSEASLNSQWVRQEINTVLRKEAQSEKAILFPIRLDNAILDAVDEVSVSLRRSRHIGDFTEWTEADRYRHAFSRLVKDLTVSAAAQQPR